MNIIQPQSFHELLTLLQEENATILAGGTDLVPHLKSGLFHPGSLVSLRKVSELHEITFNQEKIRIGAAVTLDQIIQHPRLAALYPAIGKALSLVGAPQHRIRGTIGGNLCLDTRCHAFNQSEFWRESLGHCMKKDGDICQVAPKSKRCYAVMSSDGVGILCALNAQVELVSKQGRRIIDLIDLYNNDGRRFLKLGVGEVLAFIHLDYPVANARATYRKLRPRESFDFPILGVSAAGQFENGRMEQLQIVLTAVESCPILVRAQEQGWQNQLLDEALIDKIAQHCHKLARPMQNTFGLLSWRKQMVPVLVKQALSDLRPTQETVAPCTP